MQYFVITLESFLFGLVYFVTTTKKKKENNYLSLKDMYQSKRNEGMKERKRKEKKKKRQKQNKTKNIILLFLFILQINRNNYSSRDTYNDM